jgi:cytochrome c2
MQIDTELPRLASVRRITVLSAVAAASLFVACVDRPQLGPTPHPLGTPAAIAGVATPVLTPAPNVPGNPQNGRALFTQKGCVGCHQLAAVPAKPALTGPTLTNMVLRPTIAGEQIQNTPENLVKWIMNPPAMKPGTAMPALGLSEQEAQDLAAFLYSVPYNASR